MLHKAPTPAPSLTVLEGGKTWRADEAHVELLAFLDEAESLSLRILDAVVGLPVPSMVAVDLAGKIAYRAGKARAEYWSLVGPDPSAA